nr:unnamed protein product [Callosobruchus analis]
MEERAFSDESRFGLVSDDYRERVWRERRGQNRPAGVISAGNPLACLHKSKGTIYDRGNFVRGFDVYDVYCTKYFYQLFTIHGLENGHYVPLLYCLLPNKTSDTYMRLFLLVKSKIFELYNIVFEPKEVFVDFEIAIHNALKVVFPKTKLNGCRFHLHQAWYRKIQSLGLTQMYKDKNCEESKWLTHTFGLTYLDPSEVEDCFIFDLMSYKPDHKLIDKYADNLLENYIAPQSHFPPNIWAYENPSIKRTTNACESFHSHFNSSFYSSHPSIFIFIEKLKIDAYLKIKNLNIPAKIKDKQVKNKLKLIENMVNMLRFGNISRINFVKSV